MTTTLELALTHTSRRSRLSLAAQTPMSLDHSLLCDGSWSRSISWVIDAVDCLVRWLNDRTTQLCYARGAGLNQGFVGVTNSFVIHATAHNYAPCVTKDMVRTHHTHSHTRSRSLARLALASYRSTMSVIDHAMRPIVNH